MLYDKIADHMVNTVLRQMGATKIKTMLGSINVVTFALSDDFVVQYVYEMKEVESIYLQRVTPYEHFIGEPRTPDELIVMIKEDLERYQDAFASKNFELYMQLAEKSYQAKKKREALFLSEKYANTETLQKLDNMMDRILEILDEASESMSAEQE